MMRTLRGCLEQGPAWRQAYRDRLVMVWAKDRTKYCSVFWDLDPCRPYYVLYPRATFEDLAEVVRRYSQGHYAIGVNNGLSDKVDISDSCRFMGELEHIFRRRVMPAKRE